MKFTHLLYLILTFFILSCGHNENWTEFRSSGLPDSGNSFNVLRTVSSNHLFLGGRRTETLGKSGDNYIFKNYCVLYQSNDGGKTWTNLNISKIEGAITDIKQYDSTILALNQWVSSDSTIILQSVNNGVSWESVFSCPKETYILDFRINQKSEIELIVRLKNNRAVLQISDKIDTIYFEPAVEHLHFSESGFQAILKKEDLSKYYVNYSFSGLETSRSLIQSQLDFRSTKRTSEDKLLCYSSYSTGNLLMLSDSGEYEIDLGNFENFSIKEPYLIDSLLIIDGMFQKDVAFLGVIHTFLTSSDMGKTLNEEELPSPMIFGPNDFFNGDFISYTKMNGFQIREK